MNWRESDLFTVVGYSFVRKNMECPAHVVGQPEEVEVEGGGGGGEEEGVGCGVVE